MGYRRSFPWMGYGAEICSRLDFYEIATEMLYKCNNDITKSSFGIRYLPKRRCREMSRLRWKEEEKGTKINLTANVSSV